MQPIKQAQDHGVDGDRFARTGRASDEKMRHARQIDQHRFTADRLAEAERQPRAGVSVVARVEEFAQEDFFAGGIRQFDADRVSSRDYRDACRQRAHRTGNVIGQADNARGLDAGCRLQLVKCHHRPRPRIDDLATHAEIGQHAFKRRRVRFQQIIADSGAGAFARLAQKIERRQNITAVRAARWPCDGARLARGARRGFRLVDFFVVKFIFFGSGSRPAVKTRFDPTRRRRVAAHQRGWLGRRAPAEHSRKPRAEAQYSVHQAAERNPRAVCFLLVFGLSRFFFIILFIFIIPPAGQ